MAEWLIVLFEHDTKTALPALTRSDIMYTYYCYYYYCVQESSYFGFGM
jgi:hypothetical protein